MNPPQEITTHTLSKDSWQKIEETKHDHEHNKKMKKYLLGNEEQDEE